MERVIIDKESGTVLDARTCVIVETDNLTAEELKSLDYGWDGDVIAIGRKWGVPVLRRGQADFDRIVVRRFGLGILALLWIGVVASLPTAGKVGASALSVGISLASVCWVLVTDRS